MSEKRRNGDKEMEIKWREKMEVLATKHGKNLENLSPCPECGQPFLYAGFTCAHCGYVDKRQMKTCSQCHSEDIILSGMGCYCLNCGYTIWNLIPWRE